VFDFQQKVHFGKGHQKKKDQQNQYFRPVFLLEIGVFFGIFVGIVQTQKSDTVSSTIAISSSKY
jgi:hypothetical protein